MSGLGVVWIPLRLVYPSAKWTELPLNAETPGDCDHYPSQGARPATGGFVDEGPTEIPTWAGEHNHGHMVTAVPQHPCANLTGFRLTFDLPIETRGGGREMTDG